MIADLCCWVDLDYDSWMNHVWGSAVGNPDLSVVGVVPAT